jgi:CRP-like cAMP-binding protein
VKKNKHACDLNTCILCRTCLPEWSAAVSAHHKNIEFKKGELVFQEGEPVDGIYFVQEGVVKVHKQWDEEKDLIIRFSTPGDFLGHRGLGKDSVYPISATALTAVTVCYIDLDFFQASLRVNYSFVSQLLQCFADELYEAEKRMRDLAHMQVKGRTAQALLALREKFGSTSDGAIGFTLSRQDLASYIGTTYETVFRIMNELVKEGFVSLDGKDIRLLEPSRLSLLATLKAAAPAPAFALPLS